MTWLIAKREFTSDLFTLKFSAGLLLCVSLSALISYVSLKDYELRLSDYNSALQAESLRGKIAKILPRLYRRPEVLGILCGGTDRRLGNMVQVSTTPVFILSATGYMGWRSLQFALLSGIAVVLFFLNAFVFIRSYRTELDDYTYYISSYRKTVQKGTGNANVFRRPNPLSFCVEGGIRNLPGHMVIYPAGIPEPISKRYYNFKLPYFEMLDWSFIVKFLFGIFAFILSHDAICGEKRKGTLALICSNSVRRSTILLGKYLSRVISLCLPLLGGMALSLSLILLFGDQQLSSGDLLRLALWAVFAVAYISLMTGLGLLVSSSTHTPSTSLLVLFGIWVIFVPAAPNIAEVLAGIFTHGSSEYRLAHEQDSMVRQGYEEIRKRIEQEITSGSIRSEGELKERAIVLMEQEEDKVQKLWRRYRRAVRSRQALARRISRFSPASVFQYLGESIANTGFVGQRRFEEAAERFQEVYDRYVEAKVGKLVPYCRYFRRMSFQFGGRWVRVDHPMPPKYVGSLSDFPAFEQKSPSLREVVSDSLLDISLIFVWNVLMVLSAYAAFVRYDVRPE